MDTYTATHIERHLTLNGHCMAKISRFETDHCYSDPPRVDNLRVAWAICPDTNPDTFREYGDFATTLNKCAEHDQIKAAAVASPRAFADMVSSANDFGRVITTGSLAMMTVADKFDKPKRFHKIELLGDSLFFFTLESPKIFDDQGPTPGIYRNEFSLATLKGHELIEIDPDAR